MQNGLNRAPNVIVFFTDQQRWDSTGVHGNPLGLTPHFDRMAMTGTHFSQMFTCQPVCGPARSCLQTGRYATSTGCYRNGIPLPQDARTLAHYFGEGGYDTAYIGKWHLAGHEPVPPGERGGYRYWLAANALEHTSDAYRAVVYDNEEREVHLPGYRVDALTDAAIRFVDRKRYADQPFLLFLSFLEPHHQNRRDDYPAPEGYATEYGGRWVPPDLASLGGNAHQQLGGYWGMVKRLDEALGRLLDALKSMELLESTIVLFTSDHGCHFKTRNDEYKRSCHESSIRVPAAAIGPGFDGGGRLDRLVSLIDIPPTLLDAAGIPVPAIMQGRSVLPLIRREQIQWPEEVFIQISESHTGRSIRTQRWKYAVAAPFSDGHRVAGALVYRDECLYDLQADPYELTNLIGFESHQDVIMHLRSRLGTRMVDAGEEPPQWLDAPVVKSGQRLVDPREVLQ